MKKFGETGCLSGKEICDIIKAGAKHGVIRIAISDVVIDFVPCLEPSPIPTQSHSTDLADETVKQALHDLKMQELDLTDPREYERLAYEGKA